MASPLPFPDSDDKVVAIPRGRVAVPNLPKDRWPEKRSRANSSPLAVYHDRSATPFAPPSTRDPSPAPTDNTQVESTTSGPSTMGSIGTKVTKSKCRDQTAVKRANMDAEEELVECLEHIKKTRSSAYENFHDPTIVYKKKGPPTHNGFKCKHCDRIVERAIGVSYTSGLASHSGKCGPTTKQGQSLGAYGITGGHLSTFEQVREYFALWVAESARLFCIVNDRFVESPFLASFTPKSDSQMLQLQKLLHPDARKYQPHRDTISKDIRHIYKATQGEITEMLAAQEGVFHLALDLFQSSNGLDFLGI
ncbi:hypothetical protein BDV93DRAFT_516739, partial [Ceratobasidium sp. AG-I]